MGKVDFTVFLNYKSDTRLLLKIWKMQKSTKE